jgi:hypothetical protein
MITQELVNNIFCKLIPCPKANVFTNEGFKLLADWSEKQEWWHEFVEMNGLGPYWRFAGSYTGDPYWFALTLFNFIKRLKGGFHETSGNQESC